MKHLRLISLIISALAMWGCASGSQISSDSFPVTRADIAMRDYYKTLSSLELPIAPPSPPINASQPVSRIVVGSCIDEEQDAPALDAMANEDADLTLLIGDNVYGDIDGRWYESNDADLTELREAYGELAAKPGFVKLRAARPMMAVWDDHDFGANDGGGDFPFREFAEDIFETFWTSHEDVKARPGVYDSVTFGPKGQRLQIIMLDTRFFRSPLTRTDEYGTKGKERYVPSADPYQSMLGEVQWAWLEKELQKPADLRLLVSSIQITTNVHGWEDWAKLPIERQRLYTMLAETGAVDNTVFVSGDRHSAFLYENTAVANVPVRELTASSINKAFAKSEVPNEHDLMQIGDGFAFENYGVVAVDWNVRQITMDIRDAEGKPQRSISFGF